jgi:hypothetical protein
MTDNNVYAVLEGNTVVNVILAASLEEANLLSGKECLLATSTTVIGGTYDSAKNKFISIKPYPSWVLNSNSVWVAPKARPTITDDTKWARWDEETTDWVIEDNITE